MTTKKLILLLIGLVCANFSYGAEYLRVKPDFLQTCERKMPDFSACFAQGLQHIFTTWKDGIKGIKGNEPLDPMFVEKYAVVEDTGNVAPIAVQLANITVLGLSQAKVSNASINDNDYNFKMFYTVPQVQMNGVYSAHGQILLLRINTTGNMLMNITNSKYAISAKVQLHERDKWLFFDLKSLKFKIIDIENIKLNFENLFDDNELNENTNAVFNDNWRDFFDTFQSEIEKQINKVLYRHLKGIFKSVPAKFFIADVENLER